LTKNRKIEFFVKFSSKKFAGLNFIPTFAIPKTKQPLAKGEKRRNVAKQFNLIQK
jgi:hypothetical protein